jgi:hypothetical protein
MLPTLLGTALALSAAQADGGQFAVLDCITKSAEERPIARSRSWITVLEIEQECAPDGGSALQPIMEGVDAQSPGLKASAQEKESVLRALLRVAAANAFIQRLEAGERPAGLNEGSFDQPVVSFAQCVSFATLKLLDNQIRGIGPDWDIERMRAGDMDGAAANEARKACPITERKLHSCPQEEIESFGFSDRDEFVAAVALTGSSDVLRLIFPKEEGQAK